MVVRPAFVVERELKIVNIYDIQNVSLSMMSTAAAVATAFPVTRV